MIMKTKEIKRQINKEKEDQEKDAALLKITIEKINTILKEDGMVLKPFIEAREEGIIARVRLEFAPKQEDIAKTI